MWKDETIIFFYGDNIIVSRSEFVLVEIFDNFMQFVVFPMICFSKTMELRKNDSEQFGDHFNKKKHIFSSIENSVFALNG